MTKITIEVPDGKYCNVSRKCRLMDSSDGLSLGARHYCAVFSRELKGETSQGYTKWLKCEPCLKGGTE